MNNTHEYKTLRELKELDTIIINAPMDEMKSIYFKRYKEQNGVIPCQSILLKGVYKHKLKNIINYIYFEQTSKGVEIEFYQYSRMDYTFIPIFYGILNPIGSKYGTEILHTAKEIFQHDISILINTLRFINVYVDNVRNNPKTIIKNENITPKTQKNIYSLQGNNSNKKYKNKQVVILNNKIVYEINATNNNNIIKRQYIKHIESFNVMGHTRRLKNGKLIYIKPYVKGTGKLKKKDYIVN